MCNIIADQFLSRWEIADRRLYSISDPMRVCLPGPPPHVKVSGLLSCNQLPSRRKDTVAGEVDDHLSVCACAPG